VPFALGKALAGTHALCAPPSPGSTAACPEIAAVLAGQWGRPSAHCLLVPKWDLNVRRGSLSLGCGTQFLGDLYLFCWENFKKVAFTNQGNSEQMLLFKNFPNPHGLKTCFFAKTKQFYSPQKTAKNSSQKNFMANSGCTHWKIFVVFIFNPFMV